MATSLRAIPVDVGAFKSIRFVSVTPRVDDEGSPRTDREDRPTYSVNLAVLIEQGGRLTTESIDVTVPQSSDGTVPGAGLDVYEEVGLTNCRVRMWAMEGRSGLSLSADSLRGSYATLDGLLDS